jgi:hypothetical protein
MASFARPTLSRRRDSLYRRAPLQRAYTRRTARGSREHSPAERTQFKYVTSASLSITWPTVGTAHTSGGPIVEELDSAL